MKIRHINKVISEMGVGVTEPLNCVLDNGQPIVFKTFNNEQGNLSLVNEIVAYRLAQKLQLTIPFSGLANIDENTLILINNKEIQKGIGFYSTRIEKATVGISHLLLSKQCINRDELAKFILFDHLIYNTDRNPGNILYSMREKKVYIIDHSHCFKLGCIWDNSQLRRFILEQDYKENLIMEKNYGMYFKFIGIDNMNLTILLEIANEFKSKLNREYFNQVLDEIPNEWGISLEDKNGLCDYLEYRLNNLEYICKVIINYIQRR